MSRRVLILILAVYFAFAAGSYATFSYLGTPRFVADPAGEQPSEEVLEGSLLTIDPKAAVDQPCPLNGKFYTQTEREAWEKRRPLAVMIENHPEARPQSGLGQADVVFEINAEGGVTRFMPVFYCDIQRADTTVAPVRSARYYFISYAAGFNKPFYAHVGGSAVDHSKYYTDALGFLSYIGWSAENDLNQFSLGYPTFVRDYNRLGIDKELATEHTMVSTTEKLYQAGAKRGWTNMSPELGSGKNAIAPADWKAGYKPWTFQDEEPADGTVSNVAFEFWDGFEEYGVSWAYDATSKSYKRSMAGAPHIDLNTNQQIMAKNVIVIFAKEEGPVNEKKHMIYETTGTGKALVFKNGQAIEADWSKPKLEDQVRFTVKGKDLELGRGLTWIGVVDIGTKITY